MITPTPLCPSITETFPYTLTFSSTNVEFLHSPTIKADSEKNAKVVFINMAKFVIDVVDEAVTPIIKPAPPANVVRFIFIVVLWMLIC